MRASINRDDTHIFFNELELSVLRIEELEGIDRKCEVCDHIGFCSYTEDPYASEILGIYKKQWMCEDCYELSVYEI